MGVVEILGKVENDGSVSEMDSTMFANGQYGTLCFD